MKKLFLSLVSLVALSLVAIPANAAQITYNLGNHPDGDQAAPFYGLRLDELINVTSGHDVFSFDFEHASSNMTLVYDDVANTITIAGQAFGGLDTGSSYGNPAFTGVWDINFVYNDNVSVSGGEHEVTDDSLNNTGVIIAPDSTVYGLWDYTGAHDFSFKFNNTDDHRLPGAGPDTFVGWGWLNHTVSNVHIGASDWLFTGTLDTAPVPEPSTVALLGLAALGLVSRRKKLAGLNSAE